MALLPCTCLYGPADVDDEHLRGRLIALVRDPWCPAASVHERLVTADEPPVGTDC